MMENIEYERGLTFEKVWAMFQETDRQFREMREQMKETDRQMKETDRQMKETDRRIAALSENVGGLNRSMGELIETLIAARLWEKFERYNYHLTRGYQRVKIYDETNRERTDVDILLVDTSVAVAVEVKRELNKTDDIDKHMKRMELVRRYPENLPVEASGKKLLGAVAGGTVDPDVRDYAHQAGFFVLELTGEHVRLVEPPEDFSPRCW